MKVAGGTLAVIVGFFALVGIIGAIVFGIRWVTADPVGRLEAREQILSGQNRIRAYNHFFDICASVQAVEQALQASLDELSATQSAIPPNADNVVRIQTNITGLRATRARAVAQYNADASKDYTDGQFLSIKLPYQLDATPYVSGGKLTSCAA